MYLWISWDIRFFNCWIIMRVFVCFAKNLSKSSTNMTTMSIMSAFASIYLSFLFDWFNISKCWDYIIIIWFFFWSIILKKTKIVIFVMFTMLMFFVVFFENLSKDFLKRCFDNVLLKIFVERWLWIQLIMHSSNWNIKTRFLSFINTSWFFTQSMFIMMSYFFNNVIKHHNSSMWSLKINLIWVIFVKRYILSSSIIIKMMNFVKIIVSILWSLTKLTFTKFDAKILESIIKNARCHFLKFKIMISKSSWFLLRKIVVRVFK